MENKDLTLIIQLIDRGIEILRGLNDMEETNVDKDGLPVIQIFKGQKFYNETELKAFENKVSNWQLESQTCLEIIGIDRNEFANIFRLLPSIGIDKRHDLAYTLSCGLSYLGELKNNINSNAQGKKYKKQLFPYIMSEIKIADDYSKIEVIKVLHAMCNCDMFSKMDGSKANIKDVMIAFGQLLNNNFEDYSSNLSASKAQTNENTFLSIFDKLKESEKKYFNKS